MDTLMIFLIAAIIAAIILVEFNKQQKSKLSSNIYSNDKQQLYLLTVAEYKINELENYLQMSVLSGNDGTNLSQELLVLTAAFKNDSLPLNELNAKLDDMLQMLNINALAQAC